MTRLFFILLILCGSAHADDQMSADEFEAYVSGQTLYFAQHGLAYGVEEYLPDRRVRWSFLDGDCIEGRWYPEGQDICFVYEGQGPQQCWQFFRGPSGLTARLSDEPKTTPLYEAQQSAEPMICLGPRIGV